MQPHICTEPHCDTLRSQLFTIPSGGSTSAAANDAGSILPQPRGASPAVFPLPSYPALVNMKRMRPRTLPVSSPARLSPTQNSKSTH